MHCRLEGGQVIECLLLPAAAEMAPVVTVAHAETDARGKRRRSEGQAQREGEQSRRCGEEKHNRAVSFPSPRDVTALHTKSLIARLQLPPTSAFALHATPHHTVALTPAHAPQRWPQSRQVPQSYHCNTFLCCSTKASQHHRPQQRPFADVHRYRDFCCKFVQIGSASAAAVRSTVVVRKTQTTPAKLRRPLSGGTQPSHSRTAISSHRACTPAIKERRHRASRRPTPLPCIGLHSAPDCGLRNSHPLQPR